MTKNKQQLNKAWQCYLKQCATVEAQQRALRKRYGINCDRATPRMRALALELKRVIADLRWLHAVKRIVGDVGMDWTPSDGCCLCVPNLRTKDIDILVFEYGEEKQ